MPAMMVGINCLCVRQDYQRSSSETVSFLRAWRRRALSTRRPFAEAMRARKPCLLTRLRCEGWNVLFMIYLFYYLQMDRKDSNSILNHQIYLYEKV